MSAYKNVSFDKVNITGGFWKRRQNVNRDVTVTAVYDRFSETHRFDALSCVKSDEYEPHIFWDSDVAKWLEGASYILSAERDEKLETLCDGMIEKIVANQTDDGYFNSYYITVAPDERFTIRGNHELYCAGHLIEAAIAYRDATGKDSLLRAVIRYVDLINDVFAVKQSAAFATPGHPEIELALFRLAEATGEEKYALLAKRFLDLRGNNEKEKPDPLFDSSYDQSHKPLKEQKEAVGHAVRAGYIYSAMADAAAYFDDAEYADVCEALFRDITERKMYITGGIGSEGSRESFSAAFDLPNKTAYAETCAAISLAYFARRMLKFSPDSRYADAIERVMYNGALSGVSLDGDKFFYSNALEVDTKAYMPGSKNKFWTQERVGVFDCSCCPPNILRFIASISESFYTYDEDVLFVHQYAESSAEINGASVTQKTDYPASGKVEISVSGRLGKLAVRIPGWCDSFSLNVPYVMKNGYAYVDVPSDGVILLVLDMPVKLFESAPEVRENVGKAAVTRGPVVYCLEGKDNGYDLQTLYLQSGCRFDVCPSETLGVPTLSTVGSHKAPSSELYSKYDPTFTPTTLKFIPYFAFANRGGDDMVVWVKTK